MNILRSAAFWTAIFTGILAVYTVQLYRVADTANDSTRRTQRAFVSFRGPVAAQKIVENEKLKGVKMTLGWENGGNTPARNAHAQANWQAWPYELPDGFDFKDLANAQRRVVALGPKVGAGMDIAVRIEDLAGVPKGQHLYFWGWVMYRDVFPETPIRLTEFCFELINITFTKSEIDDPAGDVGWGSLLCARHNCYDEDCPDYQQRAAQAEATATP